MSRMTLKQFIKVYCADIIKSEKAPLDLPDEMFTYDYILEVDGEEKVKIIVSEDGTQIKVLDIISLQEPEFSALYPGTENLLCYKNYLESFVILNGEEILTYYRNNILKELNRLKSYEGYDIPDALEGFV